MAAGDDSEIPGKSKHVQGSQTKEYRDSRDAMNVVFFVSSLYNTRSFIFVLTYYNISGSKMLNYAI